MEYGNKIKDKIEKLLNLSMSDNENEASIALEKALLLMREHNITKEEVYRQQMISENIELNFYKIPQWAIEIYSKVSYLSGCVFSWRRGDKKNGVKAMGRITGRERDVLNASYLISFLYREVLNAEKAYRTGAKKRYAGADLALAIKSFKIGLIHRTVERLYQKQNDFFTSETGKGLVCVDLKTRVKESDDFMRNNTEKLKDNNHSARVDLKIYEEGREASDNIEINQAVSGQEKIKKIGAQ